MFRSVDSKLRSRWRREESQVPGILRTFVYGTIALAASPCLAQVKSLDPICVLDHYLACLAEADRPQYVSSANNVVLVGAKEGRHGHCATVAPMLAAWRTTADSKDQIGKPALRPGCIQTAPSDDNVAALKASIDALSTEVAQQRVLLKQQNEAMLEALARLKALQ